MATLAPDHVMGAAGQNLVLVLKQVDLSSLGPGKYTLLVTSGEFQRSSGGKPIGRFRHRPPLSGSGVSSAGAGSLRVGK